MVRRAAAALTPGRVFLRESKFWRVREVATHDAADVWYITLEPVLRSIDDCTIAEWKAATK